MLKWKFVFACVSFACSGIEARDGDGVYYEDKPACVFAAAGYARRHMLRPQRWEPVCVERPEPQGGKP